jgi:hypothetical protein
MLSNPDNRGRDKGRSEMVKTLKRILIALGSLAAVALAGGAHWKIG